MAMFDYVMVLAVIVIGLALTHLMQGVARLVQHPEPKRIWWVHLAWVAQLFLMAVFWWWFEFRLRLIPVWTFQLYGFVLGYAFLLYLICALLFPSDLGDYQGYKDYFLSRRRWFFGLMIGVLGIDILDTLAKGRDYFASLGIEYPASQIGLILLCAVGFLSPRERVQGAVVILVFGYQVARILRFFDVVG